jgi:ATP-dependent Clp protease ATP-binding subunit ClpC
MAEIDPVIGRKPEIKELLKFFPRGKKQPILIGEPGVGKTSIVEGLAQLIKDGTTRTLLVKNFLL